MHKTTCQWCKREISVNHWEPLTNEAMKTKPIICRPCYVEYETGWYRKLIQMTIDKKKKEEQKEQR